MAVSGAGFDAGLYQKGNGMIFAENPSEKSSGKARKNPCRLPQNHILWILGFFLFALPLRAEVELIGSEGKLSRLGNRDFIVTTDGYFATDFVAA